MHIACLRRPRHQWVHQRAGRWCLVVRISHWQSIPNSLGQSPGDGRCGWVGTISTSGCSYRPCRQQRFSDDSGQWIRDWNWELGTGTPFVLRSTAPGAPFGALARPTTSLLRRRAPRSTPSARSPAPAGCGSACPCPAFYPRPTSSIR
jgi:hypothetical protein